MMSHVTEYRKGGKVQKGPSHGMEHSQSLHEWYEGSIPEEGIVRRKKEKKNVISTGS